MVSGWLPDGFQMASRWVPNDFQTAPGWLSDGLGAVSKLLPEYFLTDSEPPAPNSRNPPPTPIPPLQMCTTDLSLSDSDRLRSRYTFENAQEIVNIARTSEHQEKVRKHIMKENLRPLGLQTEPG